MNYGIILKELREKENLTIIKAAEIIDVSDSLYSRYEKEIQIIPLKHLNTLCNHYNVSFDFIFNFTKENNNNNCSKEINAKLSGQRLKEFRKEKKYTQEKFANILHVARSIIGKYENGEFLISTNCLYTICKKYNISADYLLGRIDSPKNLK